MDPMPATDNLGGQFVMQTNMKAAPGSQGTLFQGGNPTMYPRKFTPERRDAVRDAMGMPPYLLAGNRGRKSYHEGGGTISDIVRGVETVARSTVPVEHIAGSDYAFGQHRSADKADAGGSYSKANPDASNPYFRKPHVVVYKGSARDTTIIHEIGHHASATAGTEHSAYDTPSRRGQEEGFAENYAETHYRDHRGRPIGRYDTSPKGWSPREGPEGAFGGTYRDVADFDQAFHQEREKSPSAQRQRAANAAFVNNRPKGVMEGQTALLHKVTSGYQSQQHLASWDYTIEDYERGLRGPSERPWDRGGRTPEQIRNTELARNAARRARRNRGLG